MQPTYLDLLEYVPEKIVTGGGVAYPLQVMSDEEYLMVSYHVDAVTPKGRGFQEYSCTLPRFLVKTEETFEVLGLLQAEMGKTPNGNLSFSNHEYCIINKVMRWFADALNLPYSFWRWSIKLNINEPIDQHYKQTIEKKAISHWLQRTKISYHEGYPKTVTYVNENYTQNKVLRFHDYGTLVLEYKNKLFSDIMKHFVKKITYETILTFEKELIRGFMRGILAGEGTVNYHKESGHFSVHISATKNDEREIYRDCLTRIGVMAKIYSNYKEMLISKRSNLVQLLKQQLMVLSHEKYAKFCTMMKQYPNIREETEYFQPKGILVPHRIPQEKIDKIIELYKSGITRTVTLAEQLGISTIKVNRVLRANNLGRRRKQIQDSFKKEIAEYISDNLHISNEKLADRFQVHEGVINRICKKYNIKKGNKPLCKIPEEKIQCIIQIYKENPTVKISEVCKEVGVSDSVVRRVRKENNLQHLGFMHLIGNNNRKYKQQQLNSVTT